jgi:hypothetical protein
VAVSWAPVEQVVRRRVLLTDCAQPAETTSKRSQDAAFPAGGCLRIESPSAYRRRNDARFRDGGPSGGATPTRCG